jgi:hypothetical protein
MLVVLLLSGGCTSFQEVRNVSMLRNDEKVVVGQLIVEGDVRDWAPGFLARPNLIFDYELPRHSSSGPIWVGDGDGFVVYGADRGPAVSGGGGLFHVGVKNQKLYILAIRTWSSIVIMHVPTTFPILVEVAPSSNKCEYVGTMYLRRRGDAYLTQIVDDFDAAKAAFAATTEGCDIKKNLATNVPPGS